jgi:hypothetical protein
VTFRDLSRTVTGSRARQVTTARRGTHDDRTTPDLTMALHRSIRTVLAAVSRLRRRPEPAPGLQVPARLADWSDAELYSVWRATGAELVRALHAEHTATAAEARQYLLTEIERRHPLETAAWLESDALRTGGAPDFLKSDR